MLPKRFLYFSSYPIQIPWTKKNISLELPLSAIVITNQNDEEGKRRNSEVGHYYGSSFGIFDLWGISAGKKSLQTSQSFPDLEHPANELKHNN
eukprot:Pgem_evm2s13386